MAVLDNPKHERFAQELAKGRTQEEAYREAGYRGDRTAACRLATNVNVQARVTEIQERAAIRAEITVADITDRLLRIAAKGEVSNEAPMLSVARASLMDAAKLNGLTSEKLQLAGQLDVAHSARPAELQEALSWIGEALGGDGEATD